MKISRGFEIDTDRYRYDFNILCKWAQIDTSQDASYFGQWACPFELKYFSYCEGDTTLVEFDSPEELIKYIEAIKTWNDEQGHKFLGVDPGLDPVKRAKWIEIGALHLFHECDQKRHAEAQKLAEV